MRYTPETTSTNEAALKILGMPGAAGVTLVTDYQTQGVGRRGRPWAAERGQALLFTTILPVTLSPADLWTVPFWAGLAVQSGLLFHGVTTTLQWPNDLLLNGRKVAGILCVSRGMGAVAQVACGVGVNVRRGDEAIYAGIEPPPAFIGDVKAVERHELLASILQRFEDMLSLLNNPTQIARRWETAAKLKGTKYRIRIDGAAAPFECVADRLSNTGGLIVTEKGRPRTIETADAQVVR
ncbi:MAG: biotin--[acetyl-CoA-carboxylase] ligase [Candidatus Eremiobacteraeota bacterium]|nr:biotin--[acetyl-CoA-carboxylase] ligase [Candidatus Eremiobacteraeota bacterium]